MTLAVTENIPLAPYTTLQVGGAAKYFVTVSTEQELVEAVAFGEVHDLPLHILGGGSNTLVPDAGVSGLVIHIDLKGVEAKEEGNQVLLHVGAGEVFDEVVAYTVDHNWWGLENLSAIPGSVGATPVQNVGAYGVEIQDVVKEVRAYNCVSKTFVTLLRDACSFSYRDSLFKHQEGKRYIITAVTYKLATQRDAHLSYRDLENYFAEHNDPSQKEIREAVMKIRSEKFPDWHNVGTAGSFFKNPIITRDAYDDLTKTYPDLPHFLMEDGKIKLPLGWILDKVLQLKGEKRGAISSYKNQALVLVAETGATAQDIKNFADDVVARVKEKTNIDVEWEVNIMQ